MAAAGSPIAQGRFSPAYKKGVQVKILKGLHEKVHSQPKMSAICHRGGPNTAFVERIGDRCEVESSCRSNCLDHRNQSLANSFAIRTWLARPVAPARFRL